MRCMLMGWYQGVSTKTGNTFKSIVLAEESAEWHGYKVTTKFINPDIQVPDCEPGTMIDIDFDMNGFIQKGSKIRVVSRG